MPMLFLRPRGSRGATRRHPVTVAALTVRRRSSSRGNQRSRDSRSTVLTAVAPISPSSATAIGLRAATLPAATGRFRGCRRHIQEEDSDDEAVLRHSDLLRTPQPRTRRSASRTGLGSVRTSATVRRATVAPWPRWSMTSSTGSLVWRGATRRHRRGPRNTQ